RWKKDAYLIVERKNSAVGYPKVAWSVVCKPIEEGGQGIPDILALNKALMSRHLWNVDPKQPVVHLGKWIAHTRLRHKSVWTVDVKGGSWGWRKILRLRSALLPYMSSRLVMGNRSLLWHDRGIGLGSLITRFRGPGRTKHTEAAKLSRYLWMEIGVGLLSWIWNVLKFYTCYRLFTMAATLFYGRGGGFSTKAVYDIFGNHGPKVGWYSLTLGPCKIPRRGLFVARREMRHMSTSSFVQTILAVYPITEGNGSLHLAEPSMGSDIAWASKRWNGRHYSAGGIQSLALLSITFGRNVIEEFFQQSNNILRTQQDTKSSQVNVIQTSFPLEHVKAITTGSSYVVTPCWHGIPRCVSLAMSRAVTCRICFCYGSYDKVLCWSRRELGDCQNRSHMIVRRHGSSVALPCLAPLILVVPGDLS
ncbi:hypothetical protein Sango_3096600, partial [Sesamum angolense]